MALREVTHNIFQTTLFANMLPGDTSMILTTVSGLSTTSPFRLRIDDDPTNFAGTYEIVLCNGVNGATNVATISSRGVDGTSAIAHSLGAKVTAVATKSFWDAAYDPPYKARAYQNVAQSIPNNTLTKVTLDTTTYDPNANWDVATNHRWTCPVTGYYALKARAQFGAVASGYMQAVVYKNGVAIAQGTHVLFNTTASADSVVADDLFLTAGDYLELFAIQTTGTAINTGNGSQTIYLSVAWLGS